MKVLLLLLFTISSAKAQLFLGRGTPDQIIEKKKKASLFIMTMDGDKEVFRGSGTFVSKDGTFVTSHHVLDVFLSNITKYKIVFMDHSGKRLENVSLGKCGNENKIDLCVLRALKYIPEEYFNLAVSAKYPVRLGQEVAVIGNCNGRSNFHADRGKVKEYHENFVINKSLQNSVDANWNTQQVSISYNVCGGNSGGPIFSPLDGKLVAISTDYYSDKVTKKRKYNMGIVAKEVLKFVGSNSEFIKIAESKFYNRESEARKPSALNMYE